MMTKTISRLLSALLVVGMLVAMFILPASAAKQEQPNPDPEPELLARVLGLLDTAYLGTDPKIYVKADKDAGLLTKVNVHFNYTDLGGAVCLPGNAKTNGLKLSWSAPDLTLTRNGVTYKSGKAPIAPPGETYVYQATNGQLSTPIAIKTVKGSPNVDPLFLTVDQSKGTIKAMNDDPDHENECFGKAMFDGKNKYMSIKGRGNSTWVFPKKPYNITFYDDASYTSKDGVKLVKGVKAKKFSLVANHLDNTLLRNKIALDLANQMGIGLESRFMDVWMNGEYLGNYLVTPKNDYNTPENGYQLENDNYVDPKDSFRLPGMFEIDNIPGVSILGSGYFNRITVKDIGDGAKAAGYKNKQIEKHFLKAWDALLDYDSEEYQKYFDIESWAKMELMYEVTKTYDCYAGSLLMHRDGLTNQDKLIAGPAWDYDISLGRTLHKFFVGVSEPMQLNAEGWYVDHIGADLSNQPISLLQELRKHKSFLKEVDKVYNQYEWAFKDMANNVTRQQQILKGSAEMNNVRWNENNLCAEYLVAPNTMAALGTGKYKLRYHVTTGWNDYVYNLKEFCTKRVMWLSDHT